MHEWEIIWNNSIPINISTIVLCNWKETCINFKQKHRLQKFFPCEDFELHELWCHNISVYFIYKIEGKSWEILIYRIKYVLSACHMRSPVNWHLPVSLDSLLAVCLHIDALCFRNAASFVISRASPCYFMCPCISDAVFLSQEFPHLIPLSGCSIWWTPFSPFYLHQISLLESWPILSSTLCPFPLLLYILIIL